MGSTTCPFLLYICRGMSKEARNGWLAFLIPIIGLIVYGVIYKSCNDGNENSYYFVEETEYFHSTKDADKCRFIKSAKESGYHISKKSRPWVIAYDKKICKECFAEEEQKSFHKELAWAKALLRKSKEYNKWMNLDSESDCDFENLIVYIDSTNIFHIDGNCVVLKGNATRMRLSEVESIYNTCEDCVERWLCDFIYKAVYEGVYDKNVIKYPDNAEEDYGLFDNLPERER